MRMLAILVRPAGISEQEEFLNEAVGTHVRSLMVEHLTDVASTDQHTVKPWFNGKLDFAPEVKDFAAQGFPLVGGRLDYLSGRNRGRSDLSARQAFDQCLSLARGEHGSTTPALAHRRGYSVINREINGLQCCLVSDLNEKELTQLANLLGP